MKRHVRPTTQKISECSGRAGQIGDEILECIKRMFRLWHRHKVGEISRNTFQAAMKPNLLLKRFLKRPKV